MTFTVIPAGTSVFLDANTLVYHFSQHPTLSGPCTDLLERMARQDLSGFTSAAALSDVAHRVMVLEASTLAGSTGTGITKRLRSHPAEIQTLTRYRQAIQEIPHFGIQVLPITSILVESATSVSQQFGLLSGDALIVAVMQAHGLIHLASHDADFDRVPAITRYAPA